ncbi:hypothetical protein BH23ACT11_BH23ACT11_12360 [soil metagenome]
MLYLLCLAGLVLDVAPMEEAPRQATVADTIITWWAGGRDIPVRVQLLPSGDTARPLTVIVYDQVEIGNRLLAEDARLFAETAGRMLNFDPAEAFFVFRYDSASFATGGSRSPRVLLLRATFRPVRSGGLGAPLWRLISAAELSEITDRALP